MVASAGPDMPTYEFACEKCELVFDHIYESVPKKIPKRRKCPSCGKQAPKVISIPTFKVAGKAARLGKTNVTGFYNEAINDSRERLKVENTPSPYKRYRPDYDTLVKQGTLRKMSASEVKSREDKDRRVGESINNLKDKLIKKKKNV